MKIRTEINEVILLILQCIFFLFITTYYCFSFNFEITCNKQYILSFITALCTFYWAISKSFTNRLHIAELITISFVVILVISKYSLYYSTPNEHFTVIFCILVTVSCIPNHEIFLRRIWISIFIIFLAEILLGFGDLFLTLSSNHPSIKGTLENSGVFSFYCAANLPLAYNILVLHNYNRNNKKTFTNLFIFILLLLSTVLFIWINQSRTAIISVFVIISIELIRLIKANLISSELKKRKANYLIMSSIAIIASVLITYFINIKQNSLLGRRLFLKIGFEHFFDNFWTGTGLGRFEYYYPQWQSSFFQNNNELTIFDKLTAGESYLIFNEILQLFLEVGFVGFIGIAMTLYVFFRTKSRSLNTYSYKLIVLSILISGLTSYSLHVNALIYILCLCIASVFRERFYKLHFHPTKKTIYFKNVITLALCSLLFINSSNQLLYFSSLLNYRNSQDFSEEELVIKYKELYPVFKKDGKFLVEYAELLAESSNNSNESLSIIRESSKYFLSYRSINLKATISKREKDYSEAIKDLLFLSNYIPSRFKPKIELAHLYIQSGNTQEAVKIANEIINMPVKIQSNEVNSIKYEAEKLINTLQHN